MAIILKKRKLLSFAVKSAVGGYAIAVIISIIFMKLYGSQIIANSVALFHETSPGVSFDKFNFEWPVHYLLILALPTSVYWFLLGRFAYKKYGQPNWRYSLLSPIVYFVFTFDIVFPFYILATAIGGLFAYSKGASETPSHITMQ